MPKVDFNLMYGRIDNIPASACHLANFRLLHTHVQESRRKCMLSSFTAMRCRGQFVAGWLATWLQSVVEVDIVPPVTHLGLEFPTFCTLSCWPALNDRTFLMYSCAANGVCTSFCQLLSKAAEEACSPGIREGWPSAQVSKIFTHNLLKWIVPRLFGFLCNRGFSANFRQSNSSISRSPKSIQEYRASQGATHRSCLGLRCQDMTCLRLEG